MLLHKICFILAEFGSPSLFILQHDQVMPWLLAQTGYHLCSHCTSFIFVWEVECINHRINNYICIGVTPSLSLQFAFFVHCSATWREKTVMCFYIRKSKWIFLVWYVAYASLNIHEDKWSAHDGKAVAKSSSIVCFGNITFRQSFCMSLYSWWAISSHQSCIVDK